MAFPSLKYTNIDETPEDNAIKSQPQDGKVITRKKYTKTRKTFTAQPEIQLDTDFATLVAFYDTVETVLSFQWTHPITSIVYTVRFTEPISGKKDGVFNDYYNVKALIMVEV